MTAVLRMAALLGAWFLVCLLISALCNAAQIALTGGLLP